MKNEHIIKAWRDEEYRESLSEAERELLPAHPAGEIDLTDLELAEVNAAAFPIISQVLTSCPPISAKPGQC